MRQKNSKLRWGQAKDGYKIIARDKPFGIAKCIAVLHMVTSGEKFER
jgi:hypothetical protein